MRIMYRQVVYLLLPIDILPIWNMLSQESSSWRLISYLRNNIALIEWGASHDGLLYIRC